MRALNGQGSRISVTEALANEPTNWNHHLLDGYPAGAFFTGREAELIEIGQTLDDQSQHIGAGRLSICAMTGLGKSHLAHQYALQSRHRYTLSCWIDCMTTQSAADGISRLYDRLEFRYPVDGGNAATRAAEVRCHLGLTNHSWLLVMDNCTRGTFEAVRGIVPREKGHIIFTTTEEDLSYLLLNPISRIPGRERSKPMFLGDLSKEASIGILLADLDESDSQREAVYAERIFNHVRGHPLLLRMIHSLSSARRSRRSLEEVVLQIEHPAGFLAALRSHIAGQSVRRTIEFALTRLTPEARGLLYVMACLHTTNIPEIIFTPVFQSVAPVELPLEPDNHGTVACLGSLQTRSEFETLISESENLGLIRRQDLASCIQRRRIPSSSSNNPSLEGQCRDMGSLYSMHPAVRSTLRSLLAASDPDRRTLQLAADLCLAALPDYRASYLQVKLEDWSNAAVVLPHIAALDRFSKDLGFPRDGPLEALLKLAYMKVFWTGEFDDAADIVTTIAGDLSAPSFSHLSDPEFAFVLLAAQMTAYYNLHNHKSPREWEAGFLRVVLADCEARYVSNSGIEDSRRVEAKMCLAWKLIAMNPSDNADTSSEAYSLIDSAVAQARKIYGAKDSRHLLARSLRVFAKTKFKVYDCAPEELDQLATETENTRIDGYPAYYMALFRISVAYGKVNDFSKMSHFAQLAFRAVLGAVSPKHPFVAWHFLLVWNSFYLLERPQAITGLDFSPAGPQETTESMISTRQLSAWADSTDRAGLSHGASFFSLAWTVRNIQQLAVLTDDWITACTRNLEADEQLSDLSYETAHLLDTQAWDSAPGLARKFQSRPKDGEAASVYFLLWAILCEAFCYHEYNYNGDVADYASMRRTTSFRLLNERYVSIWEETLSVLKLSPSGFNAETHIGFGRSWDHNNLYELHQDFPTMLFQVVLVGEMKATELVVSHGADIYFKNHLGLSALYYAAQLHHFEILEFLLDQTASERPPQFEFGRTTLLHLVCVKTWQDRPGAGEAQARVVKALLHRGHRSGCRNAEGRLPIDLARQHRLWDIVEMLVKYGRA